MRSAAAPTTAPRLERLHVRTPPPTSPRSSRMRSAEAPVPASSLAPMQPRTPPPTSSGPHLAALRQDSPAATDNVILRIAFPGSPTDYTSSPMRPSVPASRAHLPHTTTWLRPSVPAATDYLSSPMRPSVPASRAPPTTTTYGTTPPPLDTYADPPGFCSDTDGPGAEQG
jgi:hypothetical protein